MTTKLVCRLLDASGVMLGWAVHQAQVRGDGRIWTSGPLVVFVRVEGVPHVLSVVWADVNVETRIPLGLTQPVGVGAQLAIYDKSMPVIVVGEPPTGLPPITMGEPVAVTVPAGGMGARG